MRLREKRVNCPPHCALCNSADEDSLHLFFNCPSSSNILNLSNLSNAVNTAVTQGLNSTAIIFHLLQVLSAEESALFATILWSIWKQRNNKIWNDVTDAQNFVLERASSLLYEWNATRNARLKNNDVNGNGEHSQSARVIKWSKRNRGRMKCNIDASFPNNENKIGIGICIRDDEGVFVIARTECLIPKCDVHIGEALGLLTAFQWVHELQLGPIEFELDSKKMVDSFGANRHDSTEFGAIINNCKIMFNHLYENSSVEFVRRQANGVAHELAKAATLSASFHILVTPPHCIEHILINEML